MTIADMIRYIRSKGFGYVRIERLDNKSLRNKWTASAERLDRDEEIVIEGFVGPTMRDVVDRLRRYIKERKPEKE